MSSIDEFYLRTQGHLFKKYPKRCIKQTRGAHWDTDIEVEGAGIPECNGVYRLDTKQLWRSLPMWHHENGACDPAFDGTGGGATIICDNVGKVLGSSTGGENFLIFYKGGPRYSNAPRDCHMAVPVGTTWQLHHPGHTYDGVLNEGAAPTSKRAGLSESEEAVLRAEAAEEAGCNEANGDLWLVDVEDNSEAESQNWVIKKKFDSGDSPVAAGGGGLFGCCTVTSVPPPMDAELALLKDGVEVLDTITGVSGADMDIMTGSLRLEGRTKDGQNAAFTIRLPSAVFAKRMSLHSVSELVQIIKQSRSVRQ